jgi:hypothetical protein
MPRREGPSIEERMQRAKELAYIRRRQDKALYKKLYASPLYRIARKSCIVFLWISQLMLIDWALPYLEEKDRIGAGYFNANTMLTEGVGGITSYKLSELFIRTDKGYKFTLDFPENTKEPSIGDSVVLLKSFLFHDYKKLRAPRIGESYYISSSATYRYLPFMLIIAAVAAMFVFVRNIEVKAFAWVALVLTAGFGLFLVSYMVMSFQ